MSGQTTVRETTSIPQKTEGPSICANWAWGQSFPIQGSSQVESHGLNCTFLGKGLGLPTAVPDKPLSLWLHEHGGPQGRGWYLEMAVDIPHIHVAGACNVHILFVVCFFFFILYSFNTILMAFCYSLYGHITVHRFFHCSTFRLLALFPKEKITALNKNL